MQRAADAAALAGAVYLPGDPSTAYATARAEAAKNGYTDGGRRHRDADPGPRLNRRRSSSPSPGRSTRSSPGSSGIEPGSGTTRGAVRSTRASTSLPVPMGSPENYYGVGYYVDDDLDHRPVPRPTPTADWQPRRAGPAHRRAPGPARATP